MMENHCNHQFQQATIQIGSLENFIINVSPKPHAPTSIIHLALRWDLVPTSAINKPTSNQSIHPNIWPCWMCPTTITIRSNNSRCEERRRKKIYVIQDSTQAIREMTYEKESIQQPYPSSVADTNSFANFQGFIAAKINTFVHTEEKKLIKITT